MSSSNLTESASKLLRFAFAVCIAAGLVLLVFSVPFLRNAFSIFSGNRPAEITGVILSSDTKAPLADVLVAVESSMPQAATSSGSYVKTDARGRFTAQVKGDSVTVSAWKPGYGFGGLTLEEGEVDDELTIELRSVIAANPVSSHAAFYDLKPGAGFSFSTGRVVDGDSPEADIVITQPLEDPTAAYIEAQGGGGILYKVYDGRTDFYNSPEAPQTGYKSREVFAPSRAPSEDGLYFVRTRDGKHYAKFRLNISFIAPPQGEPYLDFNSSTMLIWAYQPDGSRNLEVAPDETMPFPFYKFGVNVSNLRR